MKETVSKIVVDSSAWIDYFFTGNKKITEIIESEHFLVCSAISLHEVKKKLLREKYSEEEISTALRFMKENSLVAEVSEEICEKSASDSINLSLHTTDSIIYRTAMEHNAKIATLDSDFKNVPQAILV